MAELENDANDASVENSNKSTDDASKNALIEVNDARRNPDVSNVPSSQYNTKKLEDDGILPRVELYVSDPDFDNPQPKLLNTVDPNVPIQYDLVPSGGDPQGPDPKGPDKGWPTFNDVTDVLGKAVGKTVHDLVSGDLYIPFNPRSNMVVAQHAFEWAAENLPKDGPLAQYQALAEVNSQVGDLFLEEFSKGFATAAVQDPLDAVTQLVNHVAGHDIVPEIDLFEKLPDANVGSPEWIAQNIGAGVGIVAPIVLTGGATGAIGAAGLVEKVPLLSKVGPLIANEAPALVQLAKIVEPTAKAALDAGIYGFAFQKSGDGDDFWQDRAANSATMALTMAAQGGVTTAALGFIGQTGGVPVATILSDGSAASALKQIGSSVLGSITAGVVGAESNSLLHGNGFASTTEVVQSVVTNVATGVVFDTGRLLPGLNRAFKGEDLPPRDVTTERPPGPRDILPSESLLVPEQPYQAKGTFVLSDGRSVDPVTTTMMRGEGLTPDSYVYRVTDPQYLDFESGLAKPNPNSIALVTDPYNVTVFQEGDKFFTQLPRRNATDVGPGLNVAVEDPSPYGKPGQVMISVKMDDILKAGGRVYHDDGAAVQGVRPLYVTMNGDVPFSIVRSID